ncbi:heterocyst frequency control protein PatD [Spirulina subsalsa FACHB-351]|uniref:Heterocyst frequency control protein PatD n=1 Tax=Spirulina subsalsa FACHB-351 TaxID=234711 RepID=A0ABT3LB64_9CYAN|nr:heterocyst frequency control protein PatD [Spirulina subsalsa]MCW6038753.1 heterocyst frequency control protein PatD [Spirulina subsalsa FACHB-351]
MSSSPYRDGSEQFLKALITLKESIELTDPDFKQVHLHYHQLQTIVQENLSLEKLEAENLAIAPRQQSLLTEIHRTLRLLQTDVLFLQASRQKATFSQRLVLCRQRIDQLQQFCQQFLNSSP